MQLRPILSALFRNKTAPLLVALQVAISLAILCNALYIVNLRLSAAVRPSGMSEEQNMLRVSYFPLEKKTTEEVRELKNRQIDLLRTLPGVASVALTNQTPFGNSDSRSSVAVDRKQAQSTATVGTYDSPNSLVKTFGLRLVEGRDFTENDVIEIDPKTDANRRAKVVIVSQALAKLMYPDSPSAVGKALFFGTGSDAEEAQIIGVVETLITPSAENAVESSYTVISPIKNLGRWSNFAIRTEAGQRDRVMASVEDQLKKAAPGLATIKIEVIEKDRTRRYQADKALAWMLIAVCALLLLVTASGIVGMSTLWVTQRTKQIGVRRALGARKMDVLTYFITENLIITSGGIVFGLLFALGVNQLLVSQFELSRLPLSYLFIAPLIFWLLGIAAVFAPAWRAANTSPSIATRGA
jgi:putative ABC transport system permease protein